MIGSAEVVVVGGGPAGSTVAARLAGAGRDVVLLDRAVFPRAKPCGECVNPGAVRLLEGLGGIAESVTRWGCSMRGWLLVTPEGRRVLAEFPDGARAMGIDRRSLDAALLGWARERGVRVFEGFRVTDVRAGGAAGPAVVWGTGPDGTPFRVAGSILVGADGLRSVVARKVGAMHAPAGRRKASLTWRVAGSGPDRDRGRLYLGGELTVGLAPVPSDPDGRRGEELWNATVVVSRAEDRKALGRRGAAILRRGMAGLAPGWRGEYRLVDGPWASGPFHWPVRRLVAGRTVLIGDAAGYYDPLTGQGIYRALESADMAAEAIDRALGASRVADDGGTDAAGLAPVDGRPLARYRRRSRASFGAGRLAQRVIEAVVSRAAVRGPVFGLLERSSLLSRELVKLVGDLGMDTRTGADGRNVNGLREGGGAT